MKSVYALPTLPTKFTTELPADPLSLEESPLMSTPRAVYKSVYSYVLPDSAPNAKLLSISKAAQEELELEVNEEEDIVKVFSGEKTLTRPWSLCYAGHQFGAFTILGDGRAMSLFESVNSKGKRYELQLKGAGRTPFSRFADGFAVLRSSIREYLGSEYLAALNVPTTRALCLIATDRKVFREDGPSELQPEQGAIVTRMAPSWLRFGNFELFFARGDMQNVRRLADYVIKEVIVNDEQVEKSDGNRYAKMFKSITKLTAKMVAEWQAIGFNHGVMNTDNMSILGLTLDFGPFQIMDYYDPSYICNHSDHTGLYAFRRQPSVSITNLGKLAVSLLELIGADDQVDSLIYPDENNEVTVTDQATLETYRSKGRQYVQQVISSEFTDTFMDHLLEIMSAKIGLEKPTQKEDMNDVIVPLLNWMTEYEVDYHRFYRSLSNYKVTSEGDEKDTETAVNEHLDIVVKAGPEKSNACKEALKPWLSIYRHRLLKQQKSDDDNGKRKLRMNKVNPRFILRNSILQDVIDAFHNDSDEELSKAKEVLNVCLDACLDPFKDYYEDKRVEDWISMKVPNKDLRCSCSS